MFQISVSTEMRLGAGIGTLGVGWGLGTFAGEPWYDNLFGIVHQGVPGVRRYGFVFAGFFVTYQMCNVLEIQRASDPNRNKPPVVKSSVHGKNVRTGLNTSALTPTGQKRP